MKCLLKKILCYIICGLLTFSVTSTVYYKSVHAMEWVGGALAFEEALKWLLAAIGITATAGMTDAYWDTYGDDFTDYAIENGATQTEVAEWQLKACQGIIDKGSEVWTKFKAWAYDLVSFSEPDISLPYASPQNVYSAFCLANNITPSITDWSSLSGYNCFGAFSNVQNGFSVTLLLSEKTYTYIYNGFPYLYASDSSNFDYVVCYTSSMGIIQNNSRLGMNIGASGKTWNIIDSPYTNINVAYDNPTSGDENFQGLDNVNQNDLDVISSDGVEENEDEVTVPMPGVSDSDNEASKDAYQDIIDAINDGTITQEQGVEQIQEILKIVTYDTVTDKVVPPQQNEDGTDKTKDDALKENKENMGFTLGGLEAVFPFCIPFDIYAFMTLLVADPECPEFDFPIKSVNGQVEEIHIDLEPFEPVAVVVRYCFDFLFIIGLAMLTRSLIGGGSSD